MKENHKKLARDLMPSAILWAAFLAMAASVGGLPWFGWALTVVVLAFLFRLAADDMRELGDRITMLERRLHDKDFSDEDSDQPS